MPYKIAIAMLAVPVSVTSLIKPISAAEVTPLEVSSPSVIVAERYDDRREAQREQLRREQLRREVQREQLQRERIQEESARRNQIRRESNRRIWIPGHYESGFLGLGRKWVEGHWEDRR